MMNIVFSEIAILSKLVERANERGIDLGNFHFHAVHSALSTHEQREAHELELFGILHLDELTSEEDTFWLYCNQTSSLTMNELMAIRYAIQKGFVLLTNNSVLANMAKKLGASVLDVNDIKEQTQHWKLFKTQHIQLGRVAALL